MTIHEGDRSPSDPRFGGSQIVHHVRAGKLDSVRALRNEHAFIFKDGKLIKKFTAGRRFVRDDSIIRYLFSSTTFDVCYVNTAEFQVRITSAGRAPLNDRVWGSVPVSWNVSATMRVEDAELLLDRLFRKNINVNDELLGDRVGGVVLDAVHGAATHVLQAKGRLSEVSPQTIGSIAEQAVRVHLRGYGISLGSLSGCYPVLPDGIIGALGQDVAERERLAMGERIWQRRAELERESYARDLSKVLAAEMVRAREEFRGRCWRCGRTGSNAAFCSWCDSAYAPW